MEGEEADEDIPNPISRRRTIFVRRGTMGRTGPLVSPPLSFRQRMMNGIDAFGNGIIRLGDDIFSGRMSGRIRNAAGMIRDRWENFTNPYLGMTE